MSNKFKIKNSSKAAKFLGVSSRTLQRLRDKGKIKYYQDGHIIRYRVEDLEAYLDDHAMPVFGRKGESNHG
jgi:excisionase family DNA binding protein